MQPTFGPNLLNEWENVTKIRMVKSERGVSDAQKP